MTSLYGTAVSAARTKAATPHHGRHDGTAGRGGGLHPAGEGRGKTAPDHHRNGEDPGRQHVDDGPARDRAEHGGRHDGRMRRSAPEAPGPAEGEFDQGLAARRGAEQRAQDQIGEDLVEDDVDETAEQAGRVVGQDVMDPRPAVPQRSRVAAELGHQVLVHALGTEEIPDEDGDDGVGGDQYRDQDQRKSPDLDVVGKENHDREPDDGHDPALGGVETLRVFHRLRLRQAEDRGVFLLDLEALGDQPRAVAGDLVDDADRLDLDDVGHRNGDRHGYQRQVHEQAETAAKMALAGPGTPHRVMQRDRQHHQREEERVVVLEPELADDEPGVPDDVPRQIVDAGDPRHRVDQTDQDERDRQEVDDSLAQALAKGTRGFRLGHFAIHPLRSRGPRETRGPSDRSWLRPGAVGDLVARFLQAATAPGWYFTGTAPHRPVFAGSVLPIPILAI